MLRVGAIQFPTCQLECSPHNHDRPNNLNANLEMFDINGFGRVLKFKFGLSRNLLLDCQETFKTISKQNHFQCIQNCQKRFQTLKKPLSLSKTFHTHTKKQLYHLLMWIALSPIKQNDLWDLDYEHGVYIVRVCEKALRVHIGSYREGKQQLLVTK